MSENSFNYVEVIRTGVEIGASDIHLTVGSPPLFRVNESLVSLKYTEKLAPEDLSFIVGDLLKNEEAQKYDLLIKGQMDMSTKIEGIGRLRLNIYKQRGSYALAFRTIPFNVPQLKDLGLPDVVENLSLKDKGLVLVAGQSGSGKSTTLAGIINYINSRKSSHIITLEDPVEFLHKHNRSVINQREIGHDTCGWEEGVESALRQNPDVLMVADVKDGNIFNHCLIAAETGHLVLASLYAKSCDSVLDKIDSFYSNEIERKQIRLRLSEVLEGIVVQDLIPCVDNGGMVVACEILTKGHNVSENIKNRIPLKPLIQKGEAMDMVSMESSLKKLNEMGLIGIQEIIRRT